MTEKQYDTISRLSEEMGKPLSVLIREAVEKVYIEQAEQERRRAALQRLLSLEAPTADWEHMEEEIIRGSRRE